MAEDPPVYAILGATGGIGSDVSRRLAGRGARPVLGARSEDALDLLADETGGDTVPLDATDFEHVQQLVQHTTGEHGRIDGLVNCVGSILLKPAHLTSVEDFEQTLRLNLHTAFFSVKAAARAICYLLDDEESGWVTGQVLGVDSGLGTPSA